jgi:hypothetical protein
MTYCRQAWVPRWHAIFVVANILSICKAFASWGPPKPNSSVLPMNLNQDDECVKTSEILSLESIRSTLIRQEETIIFALIERAQFRRNEIVYKKGGFGDLGCPLGSKEGDEVLSFLEYMLMGTVSLKYSHFPQLALFSMLYLLKATNINSLGSFTLRYETLHFTRRSSIFPTPIT